MRTEENIIGPSFILGMLISAGIRYISEAIFLNIDYFTNGGITKITFLLVSFLFLSVSIYLFAIRKTVKIYSDKGLSMGYLAETLLISLTLVFLITK
ncbi:MAG: hypothetical protein KKC19_00510 [Nanoarchaeota archaeon]|nr:hypothetical protein [Nanoarchaeota archaeon]